LLWFLEARKDGGYKTATSTDHEVANSKGKKIIDYYRSEKLSLDFKLIRTKNRDLDLNNTNNKFISAQCWP
jgi:hypothetical protein